ncbi:J domain-containing protein [Kribbella sp. NBC_00709]|uniref:J domain-containing protein n=1 Tax=Kribbella sp. NBC_00709 TaxID=2975972 RepID=UPI002E2966C9|nr:J domain-containing protein [Kribbella sp. NBC_00709]
MSDHYEVLNVERTATTAEIKSAYRRLVRQVHPDQGGNAALFRLVQEAWTTLGDPAKRAAYDRNLAAASAPPEPPRYEPPRREPPRQDPPRYEPDPPPYEPPPYDPYAGDASAAEPPPVRETTPAQPSSGLRVVPRFGRWRIVGTVVLFAWLVAVVGPIVATAISSPKDLPYGIPLLCLGLAALPRQWRRRVPLQRFLSRIGILVAIAFLVTIVVANSKMDTNVRIVLYVAFGGFVLVRLVTWRWSVARELDQAIDNYTAYDANVWGRPGEPLVDDGRTPMLPPSEVLRTRRAAHLLEGVVMGLPAAKLVHGPRIGGLSVDHLVMAGSRVAVVTSIVAPPGMYSIDVYGSVLRDGRPFGGDTTLSNAINAWQGYLKRAEVRGFLVVLPASDGQLGIATASNHDAPITCLSDPAELATWLQPGGNVLDRRLLYDVLYRAPVAQA